MEIQNTKTSTAFLKIGKHFEKEKGNLSDLTSNLFFFKIESMFSEPFPKNTNQYSQYLPSSFSNYIHHSVFNFIILHQYSQYLPSFINRQIKRQI